jgi:LEA14-like dessication related protein
MRWPGWLLLASVLLAAELAACARPVPPTLTPKIARVAEVSANGIDLDIELQVDNPNGFTLYANSVTGTIYVGGGTRLARGSSRPGQSIPAHGSVSIPSRVHVAWEDATALAPLMLQASVPYSLHGEIALGSDDFHVTLPFSMSGQLSRAQLLQAGLRGL